MNTGRMNIRKLRQLRRRPGSGARQRGYGRGFNRGGKRKSNDIQGRIATVIIIICLSVAAGYLTTTYVVGPLLGLDTAPLVFNDKTDAEDDKAGAEKKDKDDKAVVEDKIDREPDGTEGLAESGYVLQYGSFSTKEAAEGCINNLKKSGIEAEIMEKDGAFKVVSPLFDNEQDARSKMETQKNIVDVFVTKVP